MVLVFGKGTVILAASDYLGGDPAIDEIYTYKYSWVDAMLHDLDDAQLQLALEFNPSHRLTEDPESLSEDPEKVPNLQALHRFEGGVEPGDLYPEQGEKEQPGFNQMENTSDEPQSPFTSRSAPSPQEEEAGWKKALTMEITPGSNGQETIQESSKEIETDASADLQDKILMPRLMCEPISFDSDLFERKGFWIFSLPGLLLPSAKSYGVQCGLTGFRITLSDSCGAWFYITRLAIIFFLFRVFQCNNIFP